MTSVGTATLSLTIAVGAMTLSRMALGIIALYITAAVCNIDSA
jgi:hypothetical protein